MRSSESERSVIDNSSRHSRLCSFVESQLNTYSEFCSRDACQIRGMEIIESVYPWSVFLLQKSEIDPRWVDFAKLSNLTKERVLADSHGLGDQGLGTGLAVRRPPVVQSSIIGYLILAGPL
jgi:hypothetical protein